jgi:hypothetical protein
MMTGNSRRTDAFRQLQQCQGTENDSDLLHSTAYQFLESLRSFEEI